MTTQDFHNAMKTHCMEANAGCESCCMRLYCYTPFCEKTDSMVREVVKFLNLEQNCTEDRDCSDHYNEDARRRCPCSMDMTTALGYEPH